MIIILLKLYKYPHMLIKQITPGFEFKETKFIITKQKKICSYIINSLNVL